VQNLLDREASLGDCVAMTKDERFLMSSCGAMQFSIEDAVRIGRRVKGVVSDMTDITFHEDMFLHEEVESGSTFKVGQIPLVTFKRGKYVETSKEYGLWKIGTPELEWCENKLITIKERIEMYSRPLHQSMINDVMFNDITWIKDDHALIAKARHLVESNPGGNVSTIYLVTKDGRLCERMGRIVNLTVIQLLPKGVFQLIGIPTDQEEIRGDQLEIVLSTLEEVKFFRDHVDRACVMWCDTGSMESAQLHLTREKVQNGEDFITIKTLLKHISYEGRNVVSTVQTKSLSRIDLGLKVKYTAMKSHKSVNTHNRAIY
jgi:hypothetical protein